MYAILIVWFLLNIGETYNETEVRKSRYWLANEIMNMADEQSKNNGIKLMERRVQTISKDKILEPFTLLKNFINDKNERLSDKFTPLVSNDIFALSGSSGSENNTENEDEDDSPNVALLKFIESKGDVFKKSCGWHQ